MLQPFVTFKAKSERILKIKYKENDVIITKQANAWMDYTLMMNWICKVLLKYTEGRHALLVFDTFKGHLKEEVFAKLTENNISYVVIPSGHSNKIQPLDVCLNKPFKTCICGAWGEYMVKQAQQSTGASSIPTLSRTEIIQWVVAANDCLSSQEDMVRKSLLIYGISNNLDGSENRLVRVSAELPTFEMPYGADEDDRAISELG